MIFTRRMAISGLLNTLAINAVPKALAQFVPATAPLSRLPRDTITTLPLPSAEYEGKMLLDMPHKPDIRPKIKAKGVHQRYDWLVFTCWVDVAKGTAVVKSLFGPPAPYDLPLPTDYFRIPMKKIGEEEMLDGTELASVLEVKNAPIMKDRIFSGKFLVLDDGTIMGVFGQEKNVAKNGTFTDVTMKMVEFHRGPQKLDVFPPELKKGKALGMNGP